MEIVKDREKFPVLAQLSAGKVGEGPSRSPWSAGFIIVRATRGLIARFLFPVERFHPGD